MVFITRFVLGVFCAWLRRGGGKVALRGDAFR